ncbi:glycosyltransferase [Propionibacteriaceae bacterium G1746]|uniref:glycosyltransferase n=1 Tax=Aestuariimicrobium sp. G57 TaxID=3418485 RepID=UPI003C19D531
MQASPLRITIVSMHTSPWTRLGTGDGGGMNVVVRAHAEQLGLRGHQVEVITRRSDPDAPERQQLAPGVTLVSLPAGPATPLPKSRIDDHLDEFSAGLAGLAPAEVVHSHHWMSGVAALPVARDWGVPHVMSYHSVAAPVRAALAEGEPPESPRRTPGERATAEQSDVVVCISHAEAATVVGRLGAADDKVVVVPPGVDHDLFHPLDQRGADDADAHGLPERPYALFAARLQPLKGADLALEALGLVETALRPRLLIAGEVSHDFADYLRVVDGIVERHGLAPWVDYAGARPRAEFAAMVRHAALMLVPSHSETFGLVALEAAASGGAGGGERCGRAGRGGAGRPVGHRGARTRSAGVGRGDLGADGRAGAACRDGTNGPGLEPAVHVGKGRGTPRGRVSDGAGLNRLCGPPHLSPAAPGVSTARATAPRHAS